MKNNQNDLHSTKIGELISNENKVQTNTHNTKMKSISRIINVLPMHDDTESFEELIDISAFILSPELETICQ